MLIRVTHPFDVDDKVSGGTITILAGHDFEAPDKQAREWIANGWAYEIKAESARSGKPKRASAEVDK